MKIKIYIALIVFSFAMIISNFLVRYIIAKKNIKAQIEELANQEEDFYPFSQSEKSDKTKELTDSEISDEVSSFTIDENNNFTTDENKQKQIALPYFNKNDDVNLEKEKENTPLEIDLSNFIKNDLEQNKQNFEYLIKQPIFRAFLDEINSVNKTQPQNAEDILKITSNPQVQKILVKYLKKPEFLQVYTKLYTNQTKETKE